MKKTKAVIASIVLASLLIGVSYAFTVAGGTLSVAVTEPLSVASAAATDVSASKAFTCTVNSCTGSAFAGENGNLVVTVHNDAGASYPVTVAVLSNSTNLVFVQTSLTLNVTASGNTAFMFIWTVSASAPPTSVLVTYNLVR